MKVLMVIDNFSSGGAQKQFCYLATGLQNIGVSITILCYNDYSQHFLQLVEGKVEQIIRFPINNGIINNFQKLLAARKIIKTGQFEYIITYQTGAGIFAAISRLLLKSPKLITCERSSRYAKNSFLRKALRNYSFFVSHKIVANSQDRVLGFSPMFKNKVNVIKNGYFFPEKFSNRPLSKKVKKFAIVGRLDAVKNPFKIIEAFEIFQKLHGFIPEINWFGRCTDIDDPSLRRTVFTKIQMNEELRRNWVWRGVVTDISKIYLESDCVLHVSLYEGTPNVICEAMLYGCPIIASDVCDNSKIITNGSEGILCDPLDANSIADAIGKIVEMDKITRSKIVKNAFFKAKQEFSMSKMLSSFNDLLISK